MRKLAIKIGNTFIYFGQLMSPFFPILDIEPTDRNFRRLGILSISIFIPTVIVLIAFFKYIIFIHDDDWLWIREGFWHWYGIFLGLVGIGIGFYVYLELSFRYARNPEEFLALFIRIIEGSKKGDKLFILAPSFSVEKAKNKLLYEKYKSIILEKLSEGVKIKFAILKTDVTVLTDFVNKTPDEKMRLINGAFKTDPLLKFHLSFPKVRENSIQYIDDMSNFYHALTYRGCKFEWLSEIYNEYSRTLIVANRKKLVFYTGNYFRIKCNTKKETLSINVNEMEERLEMDEIIKGLLKTFKYTDNSDPITS